MLTIHNNSYVYDGLSSETKPTENIPNGTIFHEIDTGDNYQFNEDAGTWVKQPSQGGGGGGGGSDLPPVTASDNGKVLGVVNGSWNKMDAPDSEPFVITLTPTAEDFSGVMDKTAAEITEAYNAGKTMIANVDASILGFDSCQFIYNGVTLADGHDNVCVQFVSILLESPSSKIIYVLTGDSSDDDTSYHTSIYPVFENLITHDYTVTYGDNSTGIIHNVEVED